MNAPRFRIAPSPTGYFHVGGARTALFNWALARRLGGTFVLRIEDTDEARNRPEWTQGIIDALAWLGICADDPHFEGPYFQSENAQRHLAAAQQLYEAGCAYYCDMTADDIAARNAADGTQGYRGWSRNRGLGPGEGRVLRFKVPVGSSVVRDVVRGDVEFQHDTLEDFVLVRSNGTPMFLLANVVDDVDMGITHVLRAEEHLPNTPKQQLMWLALGHEPPVWAHLPLLVNEQRKKISKRRDKVALEQYRDDGILAPAMINYLMTLGWSPGDQEIVPWEHIEAAFRLEDVNHSPAFFDVKKLWAFNGEYIRMMSADEFVEACLPLLESDDAPWPADRFNLGAFRAIAPVVQPRALTLTDVPGVVDFLFLEHPVRDETSWKKIITADSGPLLADTLDAYGALGAWNHESLKSALEVVGERHGLKLGKAQAPVRVAVTGRTVGPPLFEALEVLGRHETLRRVRVALAEVGSG
jgi:glutamyl-tRNA synthetase